MLKKGDIVEYADNSPDAWAGRKGSIGVVTRDQFSSDEGGAAVVEVSPVSTPPNSDNVWPRAFFVTVWKKIGHSE